MKEKKTSELVGGMIGNVIALVIVDCVLIWRQWTHGVILDTWSQILWAANLSLAMQVVGNLVLAFYRPARLYAFLQAVFAAAGFVSIVVFYVVFPLDFSAVGLGWLNTLARIVLIVAMAGAVIGFVVQLVRCVAGTPYRAARGDA